MSGRTALTRIHDRAIAGRERADERWTAASAIRTNQSLEYWADSFRRAGRLTLNFHPDRRRGVTTAAGLLADGLYRSQWITGSSAGSRSAIRGGDRQRFERDLFAAIYEDAQPLVTEHPVYGALDLLFDEHGGSPRFGSCFLVLRREVLSRTTLCVGDSHAGPIDVGMASQPWSILAGLAEQAAEHRLLNRALGVNELLCALEGFFRSPGPSRDLDGYVEAQVHGGVSLADDVDSVVLDPSFGTPPLIRT